VPLILNEPAQNGAQVWAIEPTSLSHVVEPASHRGAACCWLLSRSAGRLADDGTVTDPRDMKHRGEGGAKEAH